MRGRVLGLLLALPVAVLAGAERETLPGLVDGRAPGSFREMWAGFDPRAEPLETEVLKEWEEDGVVLRVVRFRIGVFKGEEALLAGVYGFPKGAVEGGKGFPGADPAPWTLDAVESPRNSPWFLCALAARRAITFLERQGEVDGERIGVYGHSMGGKLTVMAAAADGRVKAAAPSCGGTSDRESSSAVFEATICDDVSLREVRCPIVFLSPANDFHGRIGDLPRAVGEIKSDAWRVTCSPHGNHQDTAEYEVASLLWFDQHLKGDFSFPGTPSVELELGGDGGPRFTVRPDRTKEVIGVDVFYTQHGKEVETRFDRENTMSRFWRHATASDEGGAWTASLAVRRVEQPLWVYANVTYGLDEVVSGAGYYYGAYSTKRFNVSSLLEKVSAERLRAEGVKVEVGRSLLIEGFEEGWEKEWYSYKPEEWPRATHKVYDDRWRAPDGAALGFRVRSDEANLLVVSIDGHSAVVGVEAGAAWREVALGLEDFRNHGGEALAGWEGIRELRLSDVERLRPGMGSQAEPRVVGRKWRGAAPEFRELRWVEQVAKPIRGAVNDI